MDFACFAVIKKAAVTIQIRIIRSFQFCSYVGRAPITDIKLLRHCLYAQLVLTLTVSMYCNIYAQ